MARLVVAKKRSRQCKVWLSDEEYLTLKSNADLAGMSMVDYIVECCNNQRRAPSLLEVPGSIEDAGPKKLVGFDDTQKRVVRKCIRITPDENDFIKECAERAGLTESKFMVSRIVAAPIRFIGSPNLLRSVLYELNRIGESLGQLVAQARKLNLIAEQRRDISAERIESLAEEIRGDNERTTLALNDAIAKACKLMDAVHAAMEEPNSEEEVDGSDGL